jgi:hypothetical protein
MQSRALMTASAVHFTVGAFAPGQAAVGGLVTPAIWPIVGLYLLLALAFAWVNSHRNPLTTSAGGQVRRSVFLPFTSSSEKAAAPLQRVNGPLRVRALPGDLSQTASHTIASAMGTPVYEISTCVRSCCSVVHARLELVASRRRCGSCEPIAGSRPAVGPTL